MKSFFMMRRGWFFFDGIMYTKSLPFLFLNGLKKKKLSFQEKHTFLCLEAKSILISMS